MTWVVRRLLIAALLGTALVASAGVASAAPATTDSRGTVTYPGDGVSVHLGQEDRLAGTSADFKKFVHQRLLHLWKLAGGSQHCRLAPTVIVKSWMSSGFANVGEGIYAPCPGGGYSQIYVVRKGVWTAPKALGSQEVRSCSLMRWFGIPLPVADRTCLSDFGDLVKYRTYELPSDFSTGDYAARVLASSVEDGTGLGDAWAKPSVLDQLMAMKKDGAKTFRIQRCFGPDDAQYGALLGKAPRGCVLDVFYGSYRVLDVMRTQPARFGRWSTRALVPVASS
jgi:hypothetical protein